MSSYPTPSPCMLPPLPTSLQLIPRTTLSPFLSGKMFELRLVQGSLLKKVVDSIKDLVTEANFDCSSTGFSLQAMDSSHVALVSLLLRSEGFEHYRCDRSISMGINITNLAKVLQCAGGEDIITLKADDGTDTVTFMFESPTQDKISDYEMKLMDIDSEHLGIPEADYEAIVRMPAPEFSNICRSLGAIGETVTISVSKQGVTFSTKGDIGSGNITCRHNTSVDKPEEATVIEMQEAVSLSFAIKYINTFTKASPLASQVTISMSRDLPIVIEYRVAEMGYVRFYLAPKVEEEEEYENRANGETAAPAAVNKEVVRVEQVVGEFGKQGKENGEPEEGVKEEMEGEKSQMKVEESGKDGEDMETEDGVAGEVKMEDGSVADVTLKAEKKPKLGGNADEVMEIE